MAELEGIIPAFARAYLLVLCPNSKPQLVKLVLLFCGLNKVKNAYSVTIQTLEQVDRLLEEICYFLIGCISVVTARVQSVDARAMFIPLMRPEALIVSARVFPVEIHIGKKISLPERLKNVPYVRMRP